MSGINQLTANLTSGFIDLATYDELEKYMYGGPDATAYFVRETRKSTWFTQCPVALAKSNGTPEFGSEFSCTISRAGDYLLGTWLHVVTPAVSVKSGSVCLAWTPNFMHALVKECSITFNDLVAARFDSNHLDFWAAFTTPASKAAGYSRMIGAALPSMGSALEPQHLNLPLPFFYCRDSGVALPTAALPYNEMRINFQFRRWEELLCAFGSGAGVAGANASAELCQAADPSAVGSNVLCDSLMSGCPPSQYTASGAEGNSRDSVCMAGLAGRVPLSAVELHREPSLGSNNVQIWANYAIVSNEERKRMACAPRDILVEQVQTMPTYLFNQRYELNKNGGVVSNANAQVQNVSADIRFSHAIKVMFFAAKNMANQSVHSNYSTGVPVLRPSETEVCVAQCGLASRSQSGNNNSVYASSSGNAAYGVMTKQSCLSLGCCNAKDPLLRANLVYENTQRLGLMSVDYYSEVQPYYHAPAVPAVSDMSSTWCAEGLHMYSYSLDFMCLDPLGSTNYGKLTNVQINVETQPDLSVCGVSASQTLVSGVNNNAVNMSHASMVETLYLTGNCNNESGLSGVAPNANVSGYCEVPYQLVLTAVNNNIIRISGGALGFPVL